MKSQSFVPTKDRVFCGGPDEFTSSGQVNCPCGKVLPAAKRLDGLTAGPQRGQPWPGTGDHQLFLSKTLMKSQSFSTPSTGMAL